MTMKGAEVQLPRPLERLLSGVPHSREETSARSSSSSSSVGVSPSEARESSERVASQVKKQASEIERKRVNTAVAWSSMR